MKPIVIVDNVSKKYSRNAQAHLSYGLSDLFRELFSRGRDMSLRKDEFHAVRDISFHLNPGDTFALVGRNGSGKTTLLKMLNGLVKFDAGTIVMDGRVQALINLGAGFNSALSGRENIYNSSALMGLSRRETSAIVDEVVDFAELEEFIDSPVQTYSSGMAARLGFSVAVHLKPDILLIDEILSVGDFSFQNKCFIKMHELKKSGVTIVLVSHSHTHVMQLCDRALWIHKGRLMEIGPSKDVVMAYLKFLDDQEIERVKRLEEFRHDDEDRRKAMKKEPPQLYGPVLDEMDKIDDLSVALLVGGRPTDVVQTHDEVTIRYSFRLKVEVTDLNVSLLLCRKDGLRLTTISTLNGDLVRHIHRGEVSCDVRIKDFPFNPGTYVLVMPIHEGKSYLYRNVVKEFVVTSNGQVTWELADLQYDYEVHPT